MNIRDDTKKAPAHAEEAEPSHDAIAGVGEQPNKTPMYQASHAGRYQRQSQIKNIEARYGRRLLCYVSGIKLFIDRDDTLGFVDLLHNVPKDSEIDLLLHTAGGDIDAAEKLIWLIRATVGTGRLRVIVPDFAKSAGTLVALGADRIVMSDASELGPIDPQIKLNDGRGNLIPHSVQNYLSAYRSHTRALHADPGNMSARIMLDKIDPATVKLFQAVRKRALKLAERHMQRWMFQSRPGNFTKIARDLMNPKLWHAHGQVINWVDAKDIGLEVEYLDPKSEEWQAYWELYCLQRLAVEDRKKLFESSYVSLMLEGFS
jgi:hypothetical protein